MNAFKPELILIKGGKDEPIELADSFQEKVAEKSVIKEDVIFSEEEILGVIEQVAKQEGIARGELQVTVRVVDNQGNILALMVEVKDKKAAKQGWKSIEFDYGLKGNHGHDGGASDETSVSRVYNLQDPVNSQGGTVARYSKENGWKLSPNKVSPRVGKVTFDQNDKTDN